MRDEDEAERRRAQKFLEPLDCRNIEVVRRLVEQQHVGRTHQRLREQHAALHASRQRGEVGVGGKFQAFEHLRDAAIQVPPVLRLDLRLHGAECVEIVHFEEMVVVREQGAEIAETLCDDIEHAAVRILRHFLRELRDAHAALHAHLAVIGLDFTGEQAQQRRLAFAVAADDAHAFARIDRQVDVFEQQRTADAVVDALELQQWHA